MTKLIFWMWAALCVVHMVSYVLGWFNSAPIENQTHTLLWIFASVFVLTKLEEE